MSNILIPRRRQGTGINIAQGLVIGVVLTGLSYLVGFGAGWVETINWLEVAAVFTSYVCTFLCVMERRINYPVGAVSTTLYCILFYQFGLLASAAINGFLAVYLVYGWFRWRHDAGTLVVSRMTPPAWLGHIVVALVTYAIVFGIATALGGTLAWTDSVILVGTVLAQFMLDNKKYENWMVWAVVNVFAIYTYFTAGLALAGFQYIFFLLNAFYGLHQWKESMEAVPDDISTLDEAHETVKERYGV